MQSVLFTDTYTTPVNTHSPPLPQLFRSLCHVCLDTGKTQAQATQETAVPWITERVHWPYILRKHREIQSWTRIFTEDFPQIMCSFISQTKPRCIFFLPKCTLKLIQICCEPGEKSFLSLSFKLQPNIRWKLWPSITPFCNQLVSRKQLERQRGIQGEEEAYS